jgi:hypothetical protein
MAVLPVTPEVDLQADRRRRVDSPGVGHPLPLVDLLGVVHPLVRRATQVSAVAKLLVAALPVAAEPPAIAKETYSPELKERPDGEVPIRPFFF